MNEDENALSDLLSAHADKREFAFSPRVNAGVFMPTERSGRLFLCIPQGCGGAGRGRTPEARPKLSFWRSRKKAETQGRFLVRDLIDAATPAGLNYYQYGENSPLVYTDPLGLASYYPTGFDYQQAYYNQNYTRNTRQWDYQLNYGEYARNQTRKLEAQGTSYEARSMKLARGSMAETGGMDYGKFIQFTKSFENQVMAQDRTIQHRQILTSLTRFIGNGKLKDTVNDLINNYQSSGLNQNRQDVGKILNLTITVANLAYKYAEKDTQLARVSENGLDLNVYRTYGSTGNHYTKAINMATQKAESMYGGKEAIIKYEKFNSFENSKLLDDNHGNDRLYQIGSMRFASALETYIQQSGLSANNNPFDVELDTKEGQRMFNVYRYLFEVHNGYGNFIKGNFYKEQLAKYITKNNINLGKYHESKVNGTIVKISEADISNPDDPISGLDPRVMEVFGDLVSSMKLTEVQISSLKRSDNIRSAHFWGGAMDITRISRGDNESYFNNEANEIESPLAREAFNNLRENENVNQVFDPWWIYRNSSPLRRNIWKTDQGYDGGNDYLHRHHLHFGIYPKSGE